MKRIKYIFIFLCLSCTNLFAQQSVNIAEYIHTYKSLAIEEMQRTGVPASIKLAQGIHETMAGTSELVLKSNNHFGIKCKTGWSGEKVYHDDDENGECFRSYVRAEDSYRDHSDFLKKSSRYAFLFQLNPEDYKGWAYGLKKAGYATNIKYSQILIKLIEEHQLQQYTLAGLQKNVPADVMVNNKVENENKDTVTFSMAGKQADALAVPVYPAGMFELNQSKVIFVKGGTSLLSLAEVHQLPLSRLLEFNDMTENEGDVLASDQLIFLQRKRKQGMKPYHVVQPEEQLYDIAQVEGVRYESILEYNHLREGMEPAVGEKVYLQAMAASRPVLQEEKKMVAASNITKMPATQMGSAITHMVQTKETLYSISKKYEITVEKIMEWNKLAQMDLRIGQQLVIYKN